MRFIPSPGRIVWRLSRLLRRVKYHRETLAFLACSIAVSSLPIWQCLHDLPILRDPTAMDQAQIARHVAHGEGLQTSVIRPLTVALHPEWFSAKPGDPMSAKLHPHPEDYHAPLPLVIVGLAMAIFGEEASTVRWVVVISFLASLCMTFSLGRRVFGFPTGLLSMILVGLNPFILALCRGGSLRFVAMVLLLGCLLWTVNALSAQLTWKRAFSLGVVWGVVILCDYGLALAAVSVVLLVSMSSERHRGQRLLVALAGMLVALLPWMIRNYRVAGSPFASLSVYELIAGTHYYPGVTVFRSVDSVPASVWGFLFSHPRSLLLKWITNGSILWEVVSQVISPLLLGLLVVAWLPRQVAAERRAVQLLTLVMLSVVLSAFVTIWGSERLLVCAPVMIILASTGLVDFARRAFAHGKVVGKQDFWLHLSPGFLQGLVCAAVVVLSAFPLLAQTMGQASQGSGHPPTFKEFSTYMAPEGTVATDVPWAVAWYSSRTSIWSPSLRQVGPGTYRMPLKVQAVHISPVMFLYHPTEGMRGYLLVATNSSKIFGFGNLTRMQEGGFLLLRS